MLLAPLLPASVLLSCSTGANNIFSVLCPKISTGLEKLAPTGWHGWHVFATLSKLCQHVDDYRLIKGECVKLCANVASTNKVCANVDKKT